MRIACISDVHGNLNFNIKPCDILLIAGDLCPAYHDWKISIDEQFSWLKNQFSSWFKKQDVKECVIVFGNHDHIGEKGSPPYLFDNVNYLTDKSIELFGIKIYGTPYQLNFCNWSFNRSEEELRYLFDKIPSKLDILVTHSPPFGVLDEVSNYKMSKNIGSISLFNKIKEVKPKYSIFGHNHDGYGIIKKNKTTFINCSLVDSFYDMINSPVYFDIKNK